jgi:hypothetical protein
MSFGLCPPHFATDAQSDVLVSSPFWDSWPGFRSLFWLFPSLSHQTWTFDFKSLRNAVVGQTVYQPISQWDTKHVVWLCKTYRAGRHRSTLLADITTWHVRTELNRTEFLQVNKAFSWDSSIPWSMSSCTFTTWWQQWGPSTRSIFGGRNTWHGYSWWVRDVTTRTAVMSGEHRLNLYS